MGVNGSEELSLKITLRTAWPDLPTANSVSWNIRVASMRDLRANKCVASSVVSIMEVI